MEAENKSHVPIQKLKCAWKPGGYLLSSLLWKGFKYPSSLAPFQAPARKKQKGPLNKHIGGQLTSENQRIVSW